MADAPKIEPKDEQSDQMFSFDELSKDFEDVSIDLSQNNNEENGYSKLLLEDSNEPKSVSNLELTR